MTEGYTPPYTSTPLAPESDVATAAMPGAVGHQPAGPPYLSGASGADANDQGTVDTADTAKEQASEVKQGAVEATQHVAGVAKEQASNVTAEAGRQAKDLLDQARSELTGQAAAQQHRLAEKIAALGEELRCMAEGGENPGIATDLARHGSRAAQDMASWLSDREPGALVAELKTFARRRPGAFLVAAVGAGLLAGRLTRGLKDSSDSGGGAEQATSGGTQARSHGSDPYGTQAYGTDADGTPSYTTEAYGTPSYTTAASGTAGYGTPSYNSPGVSVPAGTTEPEVVRPYASSEDDGSGFRTSGGAL
ncbi:MAG: hypothetical protein QOE71_3556 [Pseudonocardiales bacterium]|nr:hypothetical protein [Pseudonocardiales bacterium]